MKYYVGVDGGGSKTQFAICDEEGRINARCKLSGGSYVEIGVQALAETLMKGLETLCPEAERSNIAGICFGMPAYTEYPKTDEIMAKEISRAVSPLPICFQNDVAAACAGALALQSGITILSGTGSMAFGRDRQGGTHRCGGWSEFFSDEGSCYWLGKKTLELFYKQADGRLAKGKLYEIIREHFSLVDDLDILDRLIKMNYARKEIAALQIQLENAALAGDESARELYAEAAEELGLMIRGLAGKMDMAPSSPISYAGGLFNAGELILEPLRRAISGLEMPLIKPLLTPVEGALLLAADHFSPTTLSSIKQGLLDNRIMNG